MKNKTSIITIVLLACAIIQSTAINKYDFNACRIENCISREKACISD